MIAGLVGLLSVLATFGAAAYGIHQGRLDRAKRRLPKQIEGFTERATKKTDGGMARIFDGAFETRAVHLRCWQPLKGDRTWRMQMDIRRSLPDGVSLGAGEILAPWGLTSLQLRLDDGPWGRFVCTGSNPRRLLSALLADPPAEAIATGRERFVVAAYVHEGSLTIGLRGAHEDLVIAWLADMQRLLEGLERAVDAPFVETSERTGLELERHDGAWPRLKGRAEGVQVEVWISEALDTHVEAAFHNSELAADLTLMHKDRLAGDVDLDDPVLGMTVAARCSTPDVLRGVLSAEGLSEALLEVVHRFPGSRVRGDRVELVAPRVLSDELPDAVQAVITLAAGLKD